MFCKILGGSIKQDNVNIFKRKKPGEALCDYLQNKIFAEAESSTVCSDVKNVEGFKVFIERYKAGLTIERTAVDSIK